MRRALLLLLLLVYCSATVHGLEAKWTPAEDDGGPLPASQQQRDQLSTLYDTISQSPDPSATLQRIADFQGIDAQELADILNRNQSEMQAAAGGGGGAVYKAPLNVWKNLSTLLAAVLSATVKHPRISTVLFLVAVCVLSMIISAPSTGIAVPFTSYRSIVAKGPTTLLRPPVPYVQQQIAKSYSRRDVGVPDVDVWMDASDAVTDDSAPIQYLYSRKRHNVPKKIKCITVYRKQMDMRHEFIEDDAENEEELLHSVSAIFLEHANTLLLDTLDITQWCTNDKVKLVVGTEDDAYDDASSVDGSDTCALVVKHLGSWKRYGLVPLRVTHRSAECVVLTTLVGAHFDGQFRISATTRNDSTGQVLVQHITPRRCKGISRRLSEQLVRQLGDSIATTLKTQVRVTMARQQQSQQYGTNAKIRGDTRRKHRDGRVTALEDMAEDRRRRWQRNNPNAGNYRPSGKRMQSPNNAVY